MFLPPRLCWDIGLAAGAPRRSSAGDTTDSNHQGGQGPAGVPEALLPGRVRHPQRLSGQTGLCTVSALGPALLPEPLVWSWARQKQTGSLPHSPAPGGQQGMAAGLPRAKPLARFQRALHEEVATAWPRFSVLFGDRSLPSPWRWARKACLAGHWQGQPRGDVRSSQVQAQTCG